jgi:A/G-specific adenine glycosylase
VFVIDPVEVNGHLIDAILVRRSIIKWGEENFRDFPWRITRDPYHILISEIMLHRTQARQVVPVYEQFIQIYPNINILSKATKENISKILYSLGLHWRIDLVYEMTNELMSRYGGVIPRSKEGLLSLSGVSEYIAGAVRCFSWNLPEPSPDTNTVRIAGRLFGLVIKDSSRRNSLFKNLITKLIDPDEPRVFNYAQLDLADKVCTRKRAPDCPQCPLLQWCCYGRNTVKL